MITTEDIVTKCGHIIHGETACSCDSCFSKVEAYYILSLIECERADNKLLGLLKKTSEEQADVIRRYHMREIEAEYDDLPFA